MSEELKQQARESYEQEQASLWLNDADLWRMWHDSQAEYPRSNDYVRAFAKKIIVATIEQEIREVEFRRATPSNIPASEAGELPPLPDRTALSITMPDRMNMATVMWDAKQSSSQKQSLYTADQMRAYAKDYARAALASTRTASDTRTAAGEAECDAALGRAAPAGQQEITRLDIMSLIRAQMHRVYASAIDREDIDTKYMREIEDALRALYARVEKSSTAGSAKGGTTQELSSLRSFVLEVSRQDPAQPTGQRESNKSRAEDLCEQWGIAG